MSVIMFYETSDVDEKQLTEFLKPTDHYWEFCQETLQYSPINPDTEVLSVFIHSTVTKELMDKMPKLKLIATRSTETAHIDMDYAAQRNIIVVNVPQYGENTVAEHTFAILLALARFLPQVTAKVRQGRFRSDDYVGFDLAGKTMGIIGMGHIGQRVAGIAKGFGMEVLAHDPSPDESIAGALNFRYVGLDELLEGSDIVSLHAKLNSDNYHIINASTLAKMKPGAVLVNAAHGQLVETRALLEALLADKLAGAALDTIEGEHLLHSKELVRAVSANATAPTTYTQIAEMQALLRMNNVVMTPHSGSNTREAIWKINQVTSENIMSFWYGNTPNRVIPPQTTGRLVILRHGQSEWNALGKWTGTTDVSITEKGADQARSLGDKLKDMRFDFAYTSEQVRTKETLEAFLEGASQQEVHHEATRAINERDYGIYTGMKKGDIQGIIGQEAYDQLRRSWDGPVEGGESLKDVYERTIPFYLRIILPRLRHGQNVLVVAHGNSIRALMKYIENVSDEVIGETEMPHECAIVYEVSSDGRSKSKDIIIYEEPSVDQPQEP